MTPDEVLARARSAIGHRCVYALGKGGFNPASPVPWNLQGQCDCSGFAAWCLGVGRHTDNPWYAQQNGGWLETTAIVRDALSPYGLFQQVQWEQALPSDLVVYGDAGGHQGHVGVVSSAGLVGPAAVIHCSLGNYKVVGDAIQESAPALWKMHGGIIARCALVEPASKETA